MYDFIKQRNLILQDGRDYGVKIKVVERGLHGLLEVPEDAEISDSVRKFLNRRVSTFNKHSKQGF